LVQLKALLGDQQVEEILAAQNEGKKASITVAKELSKDERTKVNAWRVSEDFVLTNSAVKVHVAVRVAFKGQVDSATSDGKLLISTGGKKARGDYQPHGSRGARDGSKFPSDMRWPKGRPDCLQFVLLKRNVDTFRALSDLARECKFKIKVGQPRLFDASGSQSSPVSCRCLRGLAQRTSAL
jgi:hypothetical protein